MAARGCPVSFLSPNRAAFRFHQMVFTIMPYILGMLAFTVSDSVEVAIGTAIVAGIFSLLNTLLNFLLVRSSKRLEEKQERTLALIGEREKDTPPTESTKDPGRKVRKDD